MNRLTHEENFALLREGSGHIEDDVMCACAYCNEVYADIAEDHEFERWRDERLGF